MNQINNILKFFVVLLTVALCFQYVSTLSSPLNPLSASPQASQSVPLTKTYDAFGEHILHLQNTGTSLELPDLREEVLFLGLNKRPDRTNDDFYLKVQASTNPRLCTSHEKIFLLFEDRNGQPQYSFSPPGKKTSLWIEPILHNESLKISVKMLSPEGQIIDSSAPWALFTAKKQGFPRSPSTDSSSSLQMDHSLLSRQKARWFGKDLFLEMHGGEEYRPYTNRQRIDFETSGLSYSCFLEEDHFLIWEEGRWHHPEENTDTSAYPLLQLKKVEERMMHFELWDQKGTESLPLKIARSSDLWPSFQNHLEIKFVGTRTKRQALIEVNERRISLSPQDWLLKTKDGWVKLLQEEQIDDFVSGNLKGELFIFDGISKKHNQLLLTGHFFSTSRTESQLVEISLSQQKSVLHSSETTWLHEHMSKTAERLQSVEQNNFPSQQNSPFVEEDPSQKKPMMRLPKVIRGQKKHEKE